MSLCIFSPSPRPCLQREYLSRAFATHKKTNQKKTKATNLNPIVAVIPFAAQALQRWQKWYLSG